jgi:hypothetical protein
VWIFFIFWPSKIRVSPTGIISSLFPPRCRFSFGRRRHATTPCVTLPSHWVKTSSLPPLHLLAMLHPVTSPLEPKLRICITVTGRPPTLHCYKKIISTLITLLITQPSFHFASSLAIAPCHWSTFPLSQDELAASTLSSSNASSRRFPSWAETDVLNMHHHRRPPSHPPLL